MAIDKYISIHQLDQISVIANSNADALIVSHKLENTSGNEDTDYVEKQLGFKDLMTNIVNSSQLQSELSARIDALSNDFPTATTSKVGGFVVAEDQPGPRTYPLSIGLSSKAYVTVPWLSTQISNTISPTTKNISKIAEYITFDGISTTTSDICAQIIDIDTYTLSSTTAELSASLSNYISYADKDEILSAGPGIGLTFTGNDKRAQRYMTVGLCADNAYFSVSSNVLEPNTGSLATTQFVRDQVLTLSSISTDHLSTLLLDVPVLTPMFMDYVPKGWIQADLKNWISCNPYIQAYQHLTADLLSAITETDEFGMTYKRALDGHKIVEISNDDRRSQISAQFNQIYDEYGTAWYYLLDTTLSTFVVPVTKYGFSSRIVENDLTLNRAGNHIPAGLPSLPSTINDITYAPVQVNVGSMANAIRTIDTIKNPINDDIYGKSNTVRPPAVGMYLVFNGGYIGSDFIHRSQVSTDTWHFYNENEDEIATYNVMISNIPLL